MLLISVPPIANPDVTARIAGLNRAYAELCAEHGFGWADVFETLKGSSAYMESLRDGIHAGPEGCEVMAEALFALPSVQAFLTTQP